MFFIVNKLIGNKNVEGVMIWLFGISIVYIFISDLRVYR